MAIPQDLKEFIELLNEKNCRYLIVGGWAFNFYADARPTGDFDFFVPIDNESESKLRTVLTDFGFGTSLAEKNDPLLLPNKVIMLGRKPFRIDILTHIDAVDFETAWEQRVPGDLGGIAVNYLAKDLLIKNKLASAREQDLRDAAVLSKI